MTLTGLLALGFGRSVLIWGFLGFAIGWPATIFLVLFGVKKGRLEQRMAWFEEATEKMNAFVEKHEKKNKDFDTVDDLFKQLEKK